MDEKQLFDEGYYSLFGAAGARVEMPGCSLCMGNQAQAAKGATVFSTSTRNFHNRLGKETKVYLGSAELAAVVSMLGKIPTPEEYNQIATTKIAGKELEVYRYLNFHEIPDYHLDEQH